MKREGKKFEGAGQRREGEKIEKKTEMERSGGGDPRERGWEDGTLPFEQNA